MTTTEGLRIVRLEAENFKRLKAIDITPDPEASTVTIAGRNAQGKSSVIDAIWAALANTAANKGTGTIRPIRDGATDARVSVDLGDLIVTRTWTGEKTQLTVSSADGARYTAPQKMLDELIGRLSFDPLSFAQLPAKAQQAELLGLVDLPFDPEELARRRADKFADRTDVGRTMKQLKGQLDGFLAFPADTPTELVSISDLLFELDTATDAIRGRNNAALHVRQTGEDVERLERQMAEIVAELDEARKEHDAAIAAEKQIIAETADAPDPDDIRAKVDTVEQTNEQVRQLQERNRVARALAEADDRYAELTDSIEDLDRERVEGLSKAEFPIEGLGFDTGGVTYQGVPFGQASAAEQLRVSVAIAMALNPKVRVIRITDGSLLDSDNLALIDEMAADRGYQVWVERVADNAESGVIIEDGQVQA